MAAGLATMVASMSRGKKAYMQYEAQLTVAIGRLGTLREDLKAAQAAITGALANVEINLTSLKDEAFAADVRRRISFRPPATTK
jgi:formiminotetrahydrofolate cyclodeaminase